MISHETAMSFLADFNSDSKNDNMLLLKLTSEATRNEPNVVALLANILGSIPYQNPIHTAIVSITIYNQLLQRQREADMLRESIKED